MTAMDRVWAEQAVQMELTSGLLPCPFEVGVWPGRAGVRFGWTLEAPGGPEASTAEICFRLADLVDRIPICLCQVHGDMIVDADRVQPVDISSPPVGDGLMSAGRRLLMGVSIADCAPVFLASRGGVAVLHAGWRGVAGRILPGALELIERLWGVSPSDVELILGPCIGPCCFEVSAAVAALFPEHVRRRHRTGWHVDLPGTLLDQWLSSGGAAQRFMRLDRCTVCGTPLMYSHRRAPNRGRNFAFMYRLESDQASPA